MAFPLSPGINVSEIDLSTVIPSLATSSGGFAGVFTWGPANEIIQISNENVLRTSVGDPSDDNASYWFTAANFLSYSNNLKLVRAVNVGSSNNAVSNTDASVLIQNRTDFEQNFNDNPSEYGPFAARYPGNLGNGLYISICPNANAYSQNLASVATSDGWTNTDSVIIKTSADLTDYVKVGDLVALQNTNYVTVTAIDSGNITIAKAFSANVDTDSPIFRRWKYYSAFTDVPATSDYVANRQGSNDEMHVVVVDTMGNFSSAGTILEKYGFVSKAYDAKLPDGSSNYYKEVINQRSKYLWSLCPPPQANVNSWGQMATSQSFSEDMDGQNYYETLVNGSDGTVTDADLLNAYNVFNNTSTSDISLMLGGPASTTLITQVVGDVVDVRKDVVFFISPGLTDVVNAPGEEAMNVLKFRDELGFSSSYVVMDSGWKYMFDKYNNVYRWVPLNGDIAGLCARTDLQRDPWYSPAGLNRGQIKNVIKLAWNPTPGERDDLYLKGINPVVTFPGEGTLLYGDKTLQSRPSAFDRINVRRLFIVLEKTIAKAARSTLFEFNDTFTRSQFRNLVEPFLRDVQGRRGITDFRVVCDETNNTPEVIDRNEFVGDIYIKPARSVNYIQLNFIAVRTDVNFDEIVGQY